MNVSRSLRGAAILATLSVCGCASTNLLKFGKDDFPKAGPKNPVTHVMAIWQPATGVGLEGRTCRGFAGQVFFITNDSPTPALIDGDIMIRLFDDKGALEEQAKPIHRFQFDSESWRTHARVGQLGLTYAVFIPYTRKGTHEASCSLMVSYTPKGGGPTLNSELVNSDLPGTKPKTDSTDEAPSGDSIDASIADQGRELRKTRIEADQTRSAALFGQTRQEAKQSAARDVAIQELERLHAPRKLVPGDEERLIREAQARLSEEKLVHGSARETPPTMPMKQRLRPNLLDDDHGDDPAEFDQVNRRSELPAPRRPSRRNPLLEDDPSGEPDDAWSADRRDLGTKPRFRIPARMTGTTLNRGDPGV